MNNEIMVELISFLVIAFRIYILNNMRIRSVIDKMFILYSLKNHSPFLGYFIMFYIEIILIAEYYLLGILDVGLLFLAAIDIFIQYKNIFINLITNDKETYLESIIKSNFKTLTRDEYHQIADELKKPQPVWKLYSTELIVFLFVVWTISMGNGFNG
jgi:hypothetical protein